MKNYLANIIACPDCHSNLVPKENLILCPICQKEYLIKNGILIFTNPNNQLFNQPENQSAKETSKISPFHYSVAHRLSYFYILKYFSLKPTDNLLDIGCGLGHFLKLAEKSTPKVVGLDNDILSLNFANQTRNENLVLASAEKLPFKDSSFDKISIILVLEHLENDLSALKEIKRVAKNNALLVIEVPALEGKRTKSKLHNLMHNSGSERHVRQGYTYNQIKTLLLQENMEIIKKQFTFVYFTEILIELMKYFYWRKNKKYDSQADILKATDKSLPFKIYKLFFPILLFLSKIEDKLLSPFLKGHALILKIKINK